MKKGFNYKKFTFLFFLSLSFIQSGLSSGDETNPSLIFDLNSCISFSNGSNASYQEFTADFQALENCTELDVVGGHLYRNDPSNNLHSCTPGYNGETAMCISSDDDCSYSSNTDKAVRFSIEVTPNSEGRGGISGISFYEKAPMTYVWNDGPSGLNNYPTRYGVRVSVNGVEIYRSIDSLTTLDWTLESYDFSDNPAFNVNTTTVFDFELSAYCTIGNGAAVNAWDIDDIKIEGVCDQPIGGLLTGGPFDFCVGDGNNDFIPFNSVSLSGETGPNTRWIATDANGFILAMPNNYYALNFDDAGVGVCFLYNISYQNVQGLSIGQNINNLEGCFSLSNSITVNRNSPEAGTLSGGPFNFCVGDGNPDLLNNNDIIISGTLSGISQWIVTDNDGTILGLPNDFTDVDFDGAGTGTCFLWHLSYFGNIQGLDIAESANDLEGCFALSNPITIERTQVDGGTITGGPFTFCVGDNQVDNIPQNSIGLSGAQGVNSQWIFTDDTGTILSVSDDYFTVNFDVAQPGTCFIYHVSSVDPINTFGISNISNLDGCLDLSNSIAVNRFELDAGTLTGGPFEFCVGNGDADIISNNEISLSGSDGSTNQWVIYNENNIILGLPSQISDVDFDGAGNGICFIANITFEGTLSGLNVNANLDNISGCYSLSNSISVTRNQPLEAVITGGPFDFCVGDGIDDVIAINEINVAGNVMTNAQWIITDENGDIIAITPDFTQVNFDGADAGTCFLYLISFDGLITGLVNGMNIDDISGCFGLSNNIQINRTNAIGGVLSGGPFSFCVTDGIDDFIANGQVSLINNIGENQQWVITDDQGLILGLPNDPTDVNFENAGTGNCLIWNLSYTGPISGLSIGSSASNLQGCFSLSNSISVFRNSVSPATLSGGPFEFCVQDGISDNLANDDITFSGQQGSNEQWIITDDQGNILGLPNAISDVNFDETESGTCLIWHLVYEDGATGIQVGANANNIEGCTALSNAISVNRFSTNGGNLMGGPFSFCATDGVSDFIPDDAISLQNNEGSNGQWIITSTAGEILGLPNHYTDVDFDNAGPGQCLVWYLSFEGELSGLNIGANSNGITGCFSLSTPVTVIRNEVNGGVLEGGPFEFCVQDGISDNVLNTDFTLSGQTGSSTQWVITDDTGNILALPFLLSTVNFDNALPGTCLIYNMSFEPGLMNIAVGMNISEIEGCFDLSNAMRVERSGNEGGTLTGGPFNFCVEDGNADFIDFGAIVLTGNSGDQSQWIITNDQGNIIGLPNHYSDVNFESAGTGSCFIYHASYSDNSDAPTSQINIADLAGCIDISNSIEVVRNNPLGGVISGGPFNFCVGDGADDFIPQNAITLSNNVGEEDQWVVTDINGNILGLPNFYTDVNFDDANLGICLIRNISYYGSLSGLTVGANINTIQGCYNESNSIAVTRNSPESGSLTGGPFSFCTGDGASDFINSDEIVLTGNSSSLFQWVITNETGQIIGLPSNFTDVDFESAGEGTCFIYYVAYEAGITGLELANNINSIDGCVDITSPIRVDRMEADGGTLTGGPFDFCVGDGQADNIPDGAITLSGNTGSGSQWVVTDETGTILGFPNNYTDVDFESAGPGQCLVWHLGFDGTTSGAEIGMSINNIGGCMGLSNPITINRKQPDAGSIIGGPFLFCVGDGLDDIIANNDIALSGYTGANSQWIVSDINGDILGLPQNIADVNFDTAGAGTCLISLISYDYTITGLTIGGNTNQITGCFDISNAIAVSRVTGDDCNDNNNCTEDGGEISFSGSDAITICVDDDVADDYTISLSNPTSTNTTYIITDQDLNILDLTNDFNFSFEGLDAGVCLIWHISYDDITGLSVGQNAADLQGCFDLSNPITVTRLTGIDCGGDACQVEGGDLSFLDGTTEMTICINETFDVNITGNSGASFDWVITDINGNIIDLIWDPPFHDLGILNSTTCVIRYLSFDGTLTGVSVGSNIANITGCFDFSNPIIVNKNNPIAGQISLANQAGALDTHLCIIGNDQECIDLDLIDNIGDFNSWIVTNNSGVISEVNSSPPFCFPETGSGTTLIYNVSYSDIDGLTVGQNTSNLSGCFAISNAVSVTYDCIEGGNILTDAGSLEFHICNDEVASETVFIDLDNDKGSSTWLITDAAGVIQDVSSPPFAFPGTGSGSTFIWHVGHSSMFGGANIGNNANDDLTGCYDLSNPIEVIYDDLDGGVVSTSSGDSQIDLCLTDAALDTVFMNTSSAVGNYSYIITDTNNFILAFSESDTIPITSILADTCLVYGISFTGLLDVTIGDDINTTIPSTQCYDLSSNAVQVVKYSVGGPCVGPILAPVFEFELFPNPAEDFIHINLMDIPYEEVDIQVVDIYGRSMKRMQMIDNTEQIVELDITNLSAGNYFIRVISDRQDAIQKFNKTE